MFRDDNSYEYVRGPKDGITHRGRILLHSSSILAQHLFFGHMNAPCCHEPRAVPSPCVHAARPHGESWICRPVSERPPEPSGELVIARPGRMGGVLNRWALWEERTPNNRLIKLRRGGLQGQGRRSTMEFADSPHDSQGPVEPVDLGTGTGVVADGVPACPSDCENHPAPQAQSQTRLECRQGASDTSVKGGCPGSLYAT